MAIKMKKDRQISFDGVNVVKFKKGDVIDNPTPEVLESFKGDYSKVTDKTKDTTPTVE